MFVFPPETKANSSKFKDVYNSVYYKTVDTDYAEMSRDYL